eukprot:gene32879-40592_t
MSFVLFYTYGKRVFYNPFYTPIAQQIEHNAHHSHPQVSQVVNDTKQQSFVANVLGIWNNHLFRSFLTPYLLDNLVYMLVLCTMHWYVSVVIQPEFTKLTDGSGIDCNLGVPVPGTSSDSWQCKSSAVTGVVLVMISIVSCVSSPLWWGISLTIGRTRAWQIGSFLSTLCILVFVFT